MPNYSESRSHRDLIAAVSAKIEILVASHIEQLLAAPADRHDHLTGIIKGLNQSRNELQAIARSWSADDEDEADRKPSRPFASLGSR